MTIIEERLLVTKTLAAKCFGISLNSFDKWPITHHEKRGREALYYLPDVIKFRLERDQSKGSNLDLTEERARLAKFQADKTELEVKQLTGELIHSEIVRTTWENQLSAMRAKLLSLPTKAAQVALTAESLHEIEECLKQIIYEALNELSNDELSTSSESVSESVEESPNATTESNSKRVGRPKKTTERGVKRGAGTVAH